MEIITVHTAQNIDIDYEIGGLGERILGLLIDYGIFIPFVIIGSIVAASIGGVATGVYFIALGVIFVFYDLLCETFFNGQSFGKRVMKIRVISLDGARPKFSQYLLRWLFRVVDLTITSGLGALITAALSENGQRIGDMVAGTILVRTVPRTKMDNIVFNNVENSYEPVFDQAGQLNDTDISLIHEVIQAYFKTGNTTVVYTMAEKLKSHLLVTVPSTMNNLLFLQTIVKDYSHIMSQAEML
jgi:uncharacterized RDD family membrane protein YckC